MPFFASLSARLSWDKLRDDNPFPKALPLRIANASAKFPKVLETNSDMFSGKSFSLDIRLVSMELVTKKYVILGTEHFQWS
jgi:hypothetical protein